MRPSITFLLCLLLAPTLAPAEEPVRALFLDYNASAEHDVLVSHLCVERCTPSRGCPEKWVKLGADYWSPDFVVFRPRYLGTADFVVGAYRNKNIDLLSMSGHHASGFSGDYGRGRFDTELLGETFGESPGKTFFAAPFFTSPGLVMLQGCRTDVKSSFDGDPVEYVLHVIEETTVRTDQFERLLAAVQQIGGVQEAYRELFPNACILGYRGTQTPGGRLEIFGQVHSWLRGLAGVETPAKFDLEDIYRSYDRARELNRRIEAECPSGWPCNLCARDPATYGPLARKLAAFLRAERERIHDDRRTAAASATARLESRFENASFYNNTRWSCSALAPGNPPVWPDPVDESPFGRLFMQLLLLHLDGMEPAQRATLQAELVHRLGTIRFTEIDRLELRVWLKAEKHWQLFQDFLGGRLVTLSTFRQQSFFAFLAEIHCTRCFDEIFTPRVHSLLRENAARELVPELGPAPYLAALADPDVRVRRAAAAQLDPSLGPGVMGKALEDGDEEVRRSAGERLGQISSEISP